MNRSLPIHSCAIQCRALFAIPMAMLLGAILPTTAAQAQTGFNGPRSAEMPASAMHQAQQIPTFPASLLAGGPAAAQGGEFMDVQGQSIQLQNYNQSCPGGCYGGDGGYCAPGGYGYGGDPMAVDFGGYGQDQCGPHYFDVSAEAVFLQGSELFNNVGPLSGLMGAANVGTPRFLDPETENEDYNAGWQISARYDIGALAVLEASYMGMYDNNFRDSIDSFAATENQPGGPTPFSLFTPFSGFGANPLVPGFDQGQLHTIDYQSDLQSTEISYRRYWVGNNPRISGTWLAGARYLRLTEEFNFSSLALVQAAAESANRLWDSENDLVGFQFGGDGWMCLRQGLRVGTEAKAGIYNNRYKFRNVGNFPANAVNAPSNFNSLTEGNQIAFAAEADASFVIDLLPSWSIKGGYRVLYLNSLATVGGNINASNISDTTVSTQSHALYHGFHSGLEYVW